MFDSRLAVDDQPQGGRTSQEHALSPREMEGLGLVCKGLTNREIAERMSITENTVKSLMSSIMVKLEARNRVETVLIAQELHLV